MPAGDFAVFDDSSEDEEEEKVRNHRRRALQTLSELQKQPRTSQSHTDDTSNLQDDSHACDDEEGEMARLRNAPKYVKFEKDLGRDKQRALLKKRKTHAEEPYHSNEVRQSPQPSDADEEIRSSKHGQVGSASPAEQTSEAATFDDHKRKKAKRNEAVESFVKSGGIYPVPKPVVPRKKIDPKIIDDSSDSESSDADSDAGHLGPQFPNATDHDASQLPLTHEVRFGTVHDGYVSSVSIDAAGARLVTGSNDGSIKFWDFNTMDSEINAFKSTIPFDGGVVKGVTFSSTGGQLLSWGALPNARILDRDGRPVAQTATGDMYIVDAARSKGHAGPIRCAEWFHSGGGRGRHIATIANEGTIRTWDIDSARRMPMEDIPIMLQLHVFKLRNKKGSKTLADTIASVSDAGQTLVAVGCNDQTVKLVDPRTFSLRPAQQFCDVITKGSEFTSISASPSSCAAPLLLVRSTDDALRVLDRRRLDHPVAEFLDLPNTIAETNACFLDADGDFFGTGTSASRRGDTKPARVTVFSRKSMSVTLHKEIEKEAGSVSCLNWHPKLNQVMYGCGDGSVRAMYDAEISSGGVLKCIVKENRKKVHGHVASGVGPIMTPGTTLI